MNMLRQEINRLWRKRNLKRELRKGVTLIELLVFVVALGILGATILSAFNLVLRSIPTIHNQATAMQSAARCAEWYLGQRYSNGFNAAGLSCPSTMVPTFCAVPNGYTINVNVACTTIGIDPNYKTITVIVGGAADASLTFLIADY